MSFAGTWTVWINSTIGERAFIMIMEQDGESLSGTMKTVGGFGEKLPIQDGKVEGGRGKWKIGVTQPMPMTLEFDVSVDGNDMEGPVKFGDHFKGRLFGDRD